MQDHEPDRRGAPRASARARRARRSRARSRRTSRSRVGDRGDRARPEDAFRPGSLRAISGSSGRGTAAGTRRARKSAPMRKPSDPPRSTRLDDQHDAEHGHRGRERDREPEARARHHAPPSPAATSTRTGSLEDVVDGGAEDRVRRACARRRPRRRRRARRCGPRPPRRSPAPARRARTSRGDGAHAVGLDERPRLVEEPSASSSSSGSSASSGSSSGTSSTLTTAIVARRSAASRAAATSASSDSCRAGDRHEDRPVLDLEPGAEHELRRAHGLAQPGVHETAAVDRRSATKPEERASRCPPSAWSAPARRSRARRSASRSRRARRRAASRRPAR